jgi:1-acyl-sn-glycerol-3-phosphate acyltransferase
VRLGLIFYCKKISISFNSYTKTPVILACNHPNSFLDALIIGSHYKHPVHFLARGDVFSKPLVNRLLRAINMIPVYRITEGREQLKYNEDTFEECLNVLENNGTVLIFSEGVCKNEYSLRPLKKGTARLAYMAWNDREINNLSIHPVSISYSSFTNLQVVAYVREGKAITQNDVAATIAPQFYQKLNQSISEQLERNSLSEEEMQEIALDKRKIRRIVIAIPAFVGWLTHKPFYNFVRDFARRKTAGTVFYQSVLFGMLLITYPLVVLSITAMVVLITHMQFYWLLLFLLPFTTWCYKEYKS